MCYRMLCVLAVSLFTAAIVVADDKSADDAKNLQGTWQAIAIEGNGKEFPADEVQDIQIVVKGNEIYAVKPEGEDPKNQFKLDPGKAPKTIDLTAIDGQRKGQVVAGIYSLNDGKLRLCINIFGQDTTQRPKRFGTQEGDGVVFATLERAKQK